MGHRGLTRRDSGQPQLSVPHRYVLERGEAGLALRGAEGARGVALPPCEQLLHYDAHSDTKQHDTQLTFGEAGTLRIGQNWTPKRILVRLRMRMMVVVVVVVVVVCGHYSRKPTPNAHALAPGALTDPGPTHAEPKGGDQAKPVRQQYRSAVVMPCQTTTTTTTTHYSTISYFFTCALAVPNLLFLSRCAANVGSVAARGGPFTTNMFYLRGSKMHLF